MMNDRYLMHYGVKGMKWGVRHDKKVIAKYSQKARVQRNANAKESVILRKGKGKAYFDDEELWDIASNKDRQEYNKLAKREAKVNEKMSNHWNKAISEINNAKNRKEAKEIFKKYRNVKGSWYIYTSDPGDKYYDQLQRSK